MLHTSMMIAANLFPCASFTFRSQNENMLTHTHDSNSFRSYSVFHFPLSAPYTHAHPFARSYIFLTISVMAWVFFHFFVGVWFILNPRTNDSSLEKIRTWLAPLK